MSQKCEFTGKGPTTGNLVSHSNIKTRTRWMPNVRIKRFLIPELGQIVKMKLSTEAIRTIDKLGGISNALRRAKPENLSQQLGKIQRALLKKDRGGKAAAKTASA